VTVRKCGKNLIPYPYADNDVTRAGITYATSEKGRITANGTSEGSYFNVVTTASKRLYFHKGVVYHLSGVPKKTGLYYAYAKDASGNNFFDYGEGCSFTPATSGFGAVTIVVSADSTISGVVFELQIEVGTEATDFERPYEDAKFIPSSDGIIEGITSLSPNMTILTNTEGMIVECEYNKDTKKVIFKGDTIDAGKEYGLEYYFPGKFNGDFTTITSDPLVLKDIEQKVKNILSRLLVIAWSESVKNMLVDIQGILRDTDFKLTPNSQILSAKIKWVDDLYKQNIAEQNKLSWRIRYSHNLGKFKKY
jgi:hypothetical protein